MKFGDAIGAMDTPNKRSSHQKSIMKGAGFGILSVFLLFSLILEIQVFIWLPGLVMSLASFWGGDKHLLSVRQRLIIHFSCSLFFLVFLLIFKQVHIGLYILCLPVSIFIVGTANIFNFMDGIDGIAGITGLFAFLLLAAYSKMSGMINPAYGSLCLALAFSCLGFLCFNIPRAKVFLGDVGSILLGFVFSCMVMAISENEMDFFVMAGFLLPFFLDEVFTMLVRIRKKESLIEPHRKHIYQILANEAGISHWKISLAYGMVQLIIGLSAILIRQKGLPHLFGAYLFYGLIFFIFSIVIRRRYSSDES